MLNQGKLFQALQKVSHHLFAGFAQEIDIASTVWDTISNNADFKEKIDRIKHSLLVPFWQGTLAESVTIIPQASKYGVISVDGSQIYYDKHQGPPCFLVNVGFIRIGYELPTVPLLCQNQPFLYTKLDADNDFGSPDFVNMQREAYEFDTALEQMIAMQIQAPEDLLVCLFDGSLIFFHLDAHQNEQKEYFLSYYCTVLEQFYQKKLLIAGYMSLPKTKELVNLCKLELAQFNEQQLEYTSVIDRLTDVDIADLYLKPHQRSIVFKSKAPICYQYPPHLWPHFCYLHVGFEIVRIEFPAWIGQSDGLVDQVCSVALDQAIKGQGYPVCLFEAHEQAVIKSHDRAFFYRMVESMSYKKAKSYAVSQKSIKKQGPLV